MPAEIGSGFEAKGQIHQKDNGQIYFFVWLGFFLFILMTELHCYSSFIYFWSLSDSFRDNYLISVFIGNWHESRKQNNSVFMKHEFSQ